MKRRNLYLLIGGMTVIVILLAAVSIYKANNYEGTDIGKFAGKWEMTELRQDGEKVSLGFGDAFLEIEEAGTVRYQDSHESYEAELQAESGRLSFINENGYKYTLSVKKGRLILDAENTKDQEDPGGQFTYKRSGPQG